MRRYHFYPAPAELEADLALHLEHHDFDHPIWISPDWPPPSQLDQLLYRYRLHPTTVRLRLLAQLGWAPSPSPPLSHILAAERHLFGGNRSL